jgi:hypothetical protein
MSAAHSAACNFTITLDARPQIETLEELRPAARAIALDQAKATSFDGRRQSFIANGSP